MTWLLDIFSGGKLALIGAAIVGALGFLWKMLADAKRSGRDAEIRKATEARERARELEIQRIKKAAAAAAAVHPDDSLSNDPFNRDNKRT